MRRIVIALMSTISGLVLLFSYHTSTNASTLPTALPGNGSGNGSGSNDLSGTSSGAASGAAADPSPAAESSPAAGSQHSAGTATKKAAGSTSKSAKAASSTFLGDPVMTRWGIVQVKITVNKASIVSAGVVQVPMDNGHDVEINNYAVPILNQAVISAQSANFDGVSGATVTSDGYKQSLQTALDKAHL
jgi:uncharacterized protein with FMN-binding domain